MKGVRVQWDSHYINEVWIGDMLMRCLVSGGHTTAITQTHPHNIIRTKNLQPYFFFFFSWMQRCCVVLICRVNKNLISCNPTGSGMVTVIPCRLAGTVSQPTVMPKELLLQCTQEKPALACYELNTNWMAWLAFRLDSTFLIPAHLGKCICFQKRYAGKLNKMLIGQIKKIQGVCNLKNIDFKHKNGW